MHSNADQVARSLETLTQGVGPYVEQRFREVYGESWESKVGRGVPVRSPMSDADSAEDANATRFHWDAHSLLLVMWDHWNSVFRQDLSFPERSLVSELREVRNRWAHQDEFNFDDAYRCLDSVKRLLVAVSAEGVEQIDSHMSTMLRDRFVEQVDLQTQKELSKRHRWQRAIVFAACGIVLVITCIVHLGWQTGWPMIALIAITYTYFVLRVWNEAQVLLGPHECRGCRRIIYDEPCPYCGRSVI